MLLAGLRNLELAISLGKQALLNNYKKNHLPMLFIHGENDTFVPFSMLDEVYNATQGPKEKYVVPEQSMRKLIIKPRKYKETVAAFLDKYIK